MSQHVNKAIKTRICYFFLLNCFVMFSYPNKIYFFCASFTFTHWLKWVHRYERETSVQGKGDCFFQPFFLAITTQTTKMSLLAVVVVVVVVFKLHSLKIATLFLVVC